MKARILLLGVFACTLVGPTLGATPVAALPLLETYTFQVCDHFPLTSAINATTFTTPHDPAGNDDCSLLCEKWVAACKGVVDATRACWTKTVAKFASVRAAICNVQSGAARASCQDVLSAEKANVLGQVDASRTSGIAYCETPGFNTCFTNCT